MTRPATTRKDHEKFCVTEGWTKRTSARGMTGTHHHNYEFALPDGRILITRISHPVNRNTYGPSLWSHILRDQLLVSNDEFWDCVDNGTLPDRGAPTAPKSAIPAGVVVTLVSTFGIPEDEVRSMTRDEAIARLAAEYGKSD